MNIKKTILPLTFVGAVSTWYVYQIVRFKIEYRRYKKLRSRMSI